MKNQNIKLLSYSISTIQRSGYRLHAPLFQFIYMPSALTFSRCAVLVGSRVDKRAVVRNRAKRLLRQSMRHMVSNLSKPIDVVLVARRADWKNLKQQHINNELRQMLIKHGLLSTR